MITGILIFGAAFYLGYSFGMRYVLQAFKKYDPEGFETFKEIIRIEAQRK